ncbi:MAG: sulfatase [Candidatus Brocadiia bacterium]
MDKPNIIFILADDLGWVDLGCMGSSFYETPHLDRLAGEGLRFTDAYASCPVCSPTRASVMTGKYPATVQITNFIPGAARGKLLSAPYLHYLPLEEKTLARALREGGYRTWHVGKWHLGEEPYWPQHHGFDVNVGGWTAGMPRSYFSPYQNPMLPDGPEGEYLPDRLADEAIRLIERNDGTPFFLNLCPYLVHIPIQGKPRMVEKYRAKAAALGLDRREALRPGEPFPCEHKSDKRVTRRLFQSDPGYAAMVQSLDENIGRLLAALEAQGLADNTVVFFTSDNGGVSTSEGSPTTNAPLAEGKGWMYEGGTREPLLVRWPGVTRPDSLCSVPVTSTDFYPTILEMAGLEPIPEQHCDGASIVPLLRGEPRLEREAIYWHYPHYSNQGGTPGCSIRTGDWKLIEFFEDRHVELYNLRQDVAEDHDLAAEEPERTRELQARLHEWLQRAGARIPEPNPDYVPTQGRSGSSHK